jgi:hypothetical protein
MTFEVTQLSGAILSARSALGHAWPDMPRAVRCLLLVAGVGGLVLFGTLAWHTHAPLPAVFILLGYAAFAGGIGAAIGSFSATIVRLQHTADRLLESVDAITRIEQSGRDERAEVATDRVRLCQPQGVM